LVCLLDTPFDRCSAGFAYLLTGLLLRCYWRARRHHGNKRRQHRQPDRPDRAHAVALPE
jgi:hypothetical protein